MDKFTLTIDLGNAAMQDGADIARALRVVADRIARDLADRGRIQDLNGNTVGHWEVV